MTATHEILPSSLTGVLLLLFFSVLEAQQDYLAISVVNDSTGHPVPFAMVTLTDTITQRLTFEPTDETGTARLALLPKAGAYRLSISALGYRNHTELIYPDESVDPDYVYRLRPVNYRLSEITVRDTLPPISYRPDTVTYNARAYYTGNERKLKDLVNKLPGLEVDAELNVTYRGEPVEILLVEGKPFFGGEGELALKGLPADAIGRVQVLEDYQPLGFTLDPAQRKQKALNIIIREEKRNVYFGEVTGGGGLPGRYRGKLDGFRFNRKTNNYLIAGGNNIRRELISFRSVMRLVGSSFGDAEESFDNYQIVARLQPPPFTADGSRQLAAIGLNHTLSDQTKVDAYGLLPRSSYRTLTGERTEFLFGELREQTTTRGEQAGRTPFLRVETTTILPEDRIFRTRIQFDGAASRDRSREQYASNRTADRRVEEENKSTLGKTQATLEWIHRPSKNQLLRARVSGAHSQYRQALQLFSTQAFLTDLLRTEPGGSGFDFNQQLEFRKNEAAVTIDYQHHLSARFSLLTEVNVSGFRQRSVTESELNERTRRTDWLLPGAALGLAFRAGKAEATVKAHLVRPALTASPRMLSTATYLQPTLRANVPIGPAGKLNFQWNTQTREPREDWLYPGTWVVNYLTYRQPTDLVPRQISHSGSVSYHYHHPIRGYGWRGTLRYGSQGAPNLLSQLRLEGTDRALRWVISGEPIRNLGANLRCWTETRNGKLTLTLRGGRRRQPVRTDSITTINRTDQQEARLHYRGFPNKDIDINWSVSSFRSAFSTSAGRSVFSAEGNGGITLHQGSWEAELTTNINVFDLAGQAAMFSRLTANLRYALPDKPWALTLNASLPVGKRNYRTFSQTDAFFSERTVERFTAFVNLGATLQL